MAFSIATIQKGQFIEPPRLLIYGVEGIGKTSIAAECPDPIFIFTEKGKGVLNIDSWFCKEWDQVVQCLTSLINEEHKFKTVVIDTVDWLEKLIHKHLCEDASKNNIEDFGFGKGYKRALSYWTDLLEMLTVLHEEKQMMIVLVSHSEIKTFKNPEGEDFDQYRLSVYEKTGAMLKEWADMVLFANYDNKIKGPEKGSLDKKGKAVKVHGEIGRNLHTEERAAYWAKNRYNMPPTMPIVRGQTWNNIEAAIEAGIESQVRKVKELQERNS